MEFDWVQSSLMTERKEDKGRKQMIEYPKWALEIVSNHYQVNFRTAKEHIEMFLLIFFIKLLTRLNIFLPIIYGSGWFSG